MTSLSVRDLPLGGVKLVKRQGLLDARGSFSRVFCAQALREAGWPGQVEQVNVTVTRSAGTLRGLHFQRPPHAEAKMVTCLRGEIFDVVVDLRAGSATLLRWHGERLSAENGSALLIPPGMAHGFQALTDDVELLYLHSMPYRADAEGGLRAEDSQLDIAWPLPISLRSPRDASHPLLADRLPASYECAV